MNLPDDVVPLGEFAYRIALPAKTAPRDALARLRALDGVVDVVVTDTHAAVHIDPPTITRFDPHLLSATHRDAITPVPVRTHVVRVRYDGEDLVEVARATGLSVGDVIAAHAASRFVVAFVGFMPGFAYLDGLDPRLNLPRRGTPRTRVEAASVAIAGARSAVYPFASPGGWHLLGHAVDFHPLDASNGSTLQAGDHVRFEPLA